MTANVAIVAFMISSGLMVLPLFFMGFRRSEDIAKACHGLGGICFIVAIGALLVEIV